MQFSVVVATYNRGELLERVTGRLVSQSVARECYEVILVDDGSTDGTAERGIALARERGIRYVRQENRGAAAARNRGIREAQGQTVAFTDDDCLVPADWLERLADGYARHPEVAGIGGGIVPQAEALEQSALARYERHVTREVYGARDEEVLGGYECPAGATNNMSYRRAVLEEVGGFDEGFPPRVWGEDADLKWRITQGGARLLYVPVDVVHVREYSLGAFLRQSVQRGRGEAHFRLKHEGRRRMGRQIRRVLLGVARLAAAPVRREPARRAVSALDDVATGLGCLTYRREQ